MKRTDNYAGNQIRLFLGELKNATHVAKVKSIQHFQTYIKTYQPNVSDDNVDYLFTGSIDGATNFGLLYWCGVDSEKHNGQLKRICGPLISLLRWLVTFPEDTIYYERFIRLPKEEIVKVNFPKHILKLESRGAAAIQISNHQSRAGSSEDAFELLCILLNDHRTLEDELDPIDIMYLLKGNGQCQEKFEEWLRKADLEHMTDALNQLKNPQNGQAALERIVKPKEWSSVNLKYIPIQEGEDVEEIEEEEIPDIPPPIPDPLGLSSLDLRETQELYSSGLLQKSSLYARRNTAALLAYDVTGSALRARVSRGSVADLEEEEDEDEEDGRGAIMYGSNEKRVIPSVIPTEKSFSVPLFLSLVHGQTPFSEVQNGLNHLKDHLVQQSRRRENLVRNHFGLFVQCADGLEWLKAYRKGIYKDNEVPRPRISSRKSTTGDAMGRMRTNTFVDKGMEKLAKAQSRLDEAKVEAKSTLAPILERMRMSREIRSAEKVLRGMSSLLEFPHQMKKHLERGELHETIVIYKRIQLIPATSSLKIVPKIKSAAESVINELRKLCFNVILTPNPHYSVILEHAALLQELDGPSAYIDILRLSFLRQLSCLLELLKIHKERFFQDSVDAFHKGQEINIISNNSLLAKGESDTIVATIRKFTAEARSRKRHTPSTTNNPFKRRTSFSDTHSPRRTSSHGSISSESGMYSGFNTRGGGEDDSATDMFSHGGGDNNTLLDETDDFLSPVDADDDWAVLNNPSPSKPMKSDNSARRGSMYSEFLDRGHLANGSADKDQQDMNATEGGNILANQDYSELFCNVIRKNFAENTIEAISRWFPCLFRISFEIISQQQKNISASTSTLPTKGNLPPTGSATKNVRALLSTSRLLATAVGVGAEFLQQTIGGLKESFRSFALPNELSSAIAELENSWGTVESLYGMKMPPNLQDDMVIASRFGDIIETPTFSNAIINHQLRLILDDIFVMYEAIESSVKTALSSLNANNNGAITNSAADYSNAVAAPAIGQLMRFDTMRFVGKGSPAAVPTIAGGTGISLVGNKLNREVAELDYNSATSPYYEPMRSLYLLSQEGVAAVAQTILDKILDKCCGITDRLSNERAVNGDGNGENSFENSLGVENAVKEFEDLIFKGLMALKKYIKRPEWVAPIVHENIFKKIVASFTEGLRRKLLFIEQGKSAAKMDQSGGPSPITRRNRKKSNATLPGGTARASLHQNTLILQSLEEELRNSDFGWERDHGDIKEKPTAWIDYLRGCIRFRAYSAPLIFKQVSKVFSVDLSNSTSMIFATPSAIPAPLAREGSVNAQGGGGNSLLNRLFAFEATTEVSTFNTPSKRPSGTDGGTPTIDGDSDRNDSNRNRTTPDGGGGGGGVAGTNATANSTGNADNLLQDRILNGLKENTKLFTELDNTTGGGFIYQNMRDVIQFEIDAVQRLLQYRIYSIKTILLSAYASLVHMEVQGTVAGSNKYQQSTTGLSMATPESKSSMEIQYMNGVLPSHLSKVILALAEERKVLTNYFNNVSIEYGGNKQEYYQTSLTRLHALGAGQANGGAGGGSGAAAATAGNAYAAVTGGLLPGQPSKDTASVMDPADSDSDGDVFAPEHAYSGNEMDTYFHATNNTSARQVGNKRPSLFGIKYNPASQGQQYGTYLFEELCKGLLDCYEDILKKLLIGQLFDLQTLKFTNINPKIIPLASTTSSSNANKDGTIIPYRSLHQCYEEFEFLKNLFRPMLLNTQILQRNPLTNSEMNIVAKEKSFITKEELMKSGIALTILIQSSISSSNTANNATRGNITSSYTML